MSQAERGDPVFSADEIPDDTARRQLHRQGPSCDVDLAESGTDAPFTIVLTKNTTTWQAELERWERGQRRILDIEAFAVG
jgi:hypothetical protein